MLKKKRKRLFMRQMRKLAGIGFIDSARAWQAYKQNGYFWDAELCIKLGAKIEPGCECCGNWYANFLGGYTLECYELPNV